MRAYIYKWISKIEFYSSIFEQDRPQWIRLCALFVYSLVDANDTGNAEAFGHSIQFYD